MRNLINVRCWSRLTYLNILSYRNLWDTRTLGTLTIIFVNIPPGFLCHCRHYRHCTPALTPLDIMLHDTEERCFRDSPSPGTYLGVGTRTFDSRLSNICFKDQLGIIHLKSHVHSKPHFPVQCKVLPGSYTWVLH